MKLKLSSLGGIFPKLTNSRTKAQKSENLSGASVRQLESKGAVNKPVLSSRDPHYDTNVSAKSLADRYCYIRESVSELTGEEENPKSTLAWIDIHPNKATGEFSCAPGEKATLSSIESGESAYKLTSLTFEIAGQTATQNPDRMHHPVAVYGLSVPQIELINLARSNYGMDNMSTIANYNKRIGLFPPQNLSSYQTVHYFCQVIWQASRGKLIENVSKDNKETLNPMILEWADYLKMNWRQLDPIKRLKKIAVRAQDDEAQQKALIKQFVIKNTTSDIKADKLVGYLRQVVRDSEVKDAGSFFNKIKLQEHRPDRDVLDGLYCLFQTHFFRNTSKLGLQFFAERDVDIAFAWNDSKDGLLDIDTIQDKPWSRYEQRVEGQYEPITYSEIRYVLRNPELFGDKVSKVFIPKGGQQVKVAVPLTSDEWADEVKPKPVFTHATDDEVSSFFNK